jgi:hypothetical protein
VDVDQTDRDPRRDARRPRHRDVQRRVLVAVADFGPQHFACRRQAHGRLLVEQRVHVTRQLLGAGTRIGGAANRNLGLGDDLGRVALDERLRRKIPRRLRVGGARLQILRIAQLEDAAVEMLGHAFEIGLRQIRAVEPQPHPAHVARFGNPRRHRPRQDCRRL